MKDSFLISQIQQLSMGTNPRLGLLIRYCMMTLMQSQFHSFWVGIAFEGDIRRCVSAHEQDDPSINTTRRKPLVEVLCERPLMRAVSETLIWTDMHIIK